MVADLPSIFVVVGVGKGDWVVGGCGGTFDCFCVLWTGNASVF